MAFLPGQSGNPSGRPKLPEEIAESRKVNRLEFERAANKFLYMTASEIKETLGSPVATGLELMIGSLIVSGIQDGDYQRLSFLLDRLIGRVKETIEITTQQLLPTAAEARRILDEDFAMLPAGEVRVEDL